MDGETFENSIKSLGSNREDLFRETILDDVRWEIYLFLLSRETEEDYFDLTKYIEKIGDSDYIKPIFNSLRKSGWKCDLSYGDTAVFIYKGEKPKSCW